MPQVERNREIKRRRHRRIKVKDLRERLNKERDTKARTRLIAKLKKVSPNSPVPEK
jgi:indole-3-glycerol phosphate synthase